MVKSEIILYVEFTALLLRSNAFFLSLLLALPVDVEFWAKPFPPHSDDLSLR
jgi:hypothetical protein